MAIGIKSNPILGIIQKLNSAIVFVQLVPKSFIQILTYMMQTSDDAVQSEVSVSVKRRRKRQSRRMEEYKCIQQLQFK